MTNPNTPTTEARLRDLLSNLAGLQMARKDSGWEFAPAGAEADSPEADHYLDSMASTLGHRNMTMAAHWGRKAAEAMFPGATLPSTYRIQLELIEERVAFITAALAELRREVAA